MTSLPANERLVLFSGALTVAAGVNKFDAPKRVNAALPPGLKVVVLLSGRLNIQLDGQPGREICGPAAIIIRNSGEVSRDQVFAPDIPVRYALVQMDDAISGEKLGSALDRLAEPSFSSHRGKGGVMLSCPAGRMLQSLAAQIMSCPIHGSERDLYLGGKALQLAAIAVAHCVSNREAHATLRLSLRDVENIRKARDLLIASMQSPPGLDELAQSAGLNVRKLNSGFRQVFGSTVFEFLQEYRLEQAYKLLAGGDMSVSEVAYHVGYGAAHFATIFRKRFGISPSQLR